MKLTIRNSPTTAYNFGGCDRDEIQLRPTLPRVPFSPFSTTPNQIQLVSCFHNFVYFEYFVVNSSAISMFQIKTLRHFNNFNAAPQKAPPFQHFNLAIFIREIRAIRGHPLSLVIPPLPASSTVPIANPNPFPQTHPRQ